MILRIIIGIFVCMLFIFILFWILTGGPARAIQIVGGLDNPLNAFTGTTTGTSLRLPWQPEVVVPGADISQYTTGDSGSGNQPSTIDTQPDQVKTFGNPSPYAGEVTFTGHDSGGGNQNTEYVLIQAKDTNTGPMTLTGWSLQSAVSGTRSPIPQAASPLITGILNNVAPVSLPPGAYATVVSGPSPVGVSFRENKCAGFLAELQTFTPELEETCPSPGDALALTPENIQAYGEACFDYLSSIPQCHFPGSNQTANVSNACKAFAANVLSYNGCVNTHRNDSDFTTTSWRLFLASGVQLWHDSHDVIRLLDEQGRTVDVLTY